MINYPPDYTPSPKRTPEEIMLELDRRCGYTQGEVRTIDPKTVKSPEPPEEHKFQPGRFIRAVVKRSKGRFTKK